MMTIINQVFDRTASGCRRQSCFRGSCSLEPRAHEVSRISAGETQGNRAAHLATLVEPDLRASSLGFFRRGTKRQG